MWFTFGFVSTIDCRREAEARGPTHNTILRRLPNGEPETREAVRAFHAGDKRRRAEVDAEARRETPSSGSEARSKEPRINDAARRARRLAQILLARGECEAQARASRALRRGSSACLLARQEAFRIRCAPAPTLANRDRRDRQARARS